MFFGVVHKKYTYKNGKRYGPYYYETKRVNGKIVTTYLGPTNPHAQKKTDDFHERFHKVVTRADTRRRTARRKKRLPLALLAGAGFFGVLLLLFVLPQAFLTGFASLDIQATYAPGEQVGGDIVLSVQEGTLLPADTLVEVTLGDQVTTIPLRDLLGTESELSGTYYLEGSSLTGEGSGFGLAGAREVYPELLFSLAVSGAGSQGSGSDSSNADEDEAEPSESADNETVPEEPETSNQTTSDSETTEETESEEAQETESEGSTDTPSESTDESSDQTESTDEATPESDTGAPAEETGAVDESASEESSTGEAQDAESDDSQSESSEESSSASESSSEDSGSNDAPSESSDSSSEDSGSGPGITGAVIAEDTLIVTGSVSAVTQYEYELGIGEIATLVEGSVLLDNATLPDETLTVTLTSDAAVVSTDYSQTLEGFGTNFSGEATTSFTLDVSLFDIIAEEDSVMRVRFVYANATLLETEEDIAVDETAVVETLNETLNESLPIESLPAGVITEQSQAVLGQPVTWVRTIEVEVNETNTSLAIQVPTTAVDVLVTIEEASESVALEVGSIEDYEDSVIELDEDGTGEEDEDDADIVIGIDDAIVERKRALPEQARAVGLTGRAVEQLPEQAALIAQENVVEVRVDVGPASERVSVTYTTPAPTTVERDLPNGKEVVVSSPEGVHYTNVLAFTDLPESLEITNPSHVRIHWVEGGRTIVPETIRDTDTNGVYDYIEWVAPHLSNQTFNIIVIIGAEHLDENRTFISDIYDDVKELDGNWSEPIPDGHYVRVQFERNLTSDRDITVYPRTVSGTPRIEIYEINGSDLVAEFTSLTDNEYNKVFLDNLVSDSQDRFDLLILDGVVEFDLIIDPTQLFFESCPLFFDNTWTVSPAFTWGGGSTCQSVDDSDARMTSTPINLDGYDAANLSFDWTANASLDKFWVRANSTDNATHITVWNWSSGTSGSEEIDLSQYITMTNVTIRGYCNQGRSGGTCGWDNINVTGYTFGGGGGFDGNLSSCQTISTSGMYQVNQSISTTTSCFTIAVDDVYIDGQGYNIDGDDGALDFAFNTTGGLTNITITNTNVTDFGIGVRFDSQPNMTVQDSFFGSLSNAVMYLGGTSDNNVFLNLTIVDSNIGLYFASSSSLTNNSFTNITIDGMNSQAVVFDASSVAPNTVLDGLVITNTNNQYHDLLFTTTANTSGLQIIDSYIENYSSSGTSNVIFSVEDRSYGKITFLDTVAESGTNFSDDIRITDNNAYIDRTNEPGLQVWANVTLYGTPGAGLTNPAVFGGSSVCSDCSNFTSLTVATVAFNISDNADSYSIKNDGPIELSACQHISISAAYNLTTSITDGQEPCFEITADDVVFNGAGFTLNGEDNGIAIEVTTAHNVTVANLTIEQYTTGIYSVNSNDTHYENIDVDESGTNDLLFENVNHATLLNISFKNSQGSEAVKLGGSSRYNNFTNVTLIGFTQDGLLFTGAAHDNRFEQLSSDGGVGGSLDFYFDTSINGTVFVDSSLGKYNLFAAGGTLTVEDSAYGNVHFIEAVNGSGSNFTEEIQISSNLAYVNVSNVGLNRSANVTLKGLSLGSDGGLRSVARNGEYCADCANFTSLSASIVQFNVSAWSSYTIDDTCKPLTNPGTYTLTQNITTTGTCLDIDSSDVIVNGAGYTVTGDDGGSDYGAIVTGAYDNVTVQGINLVDFGYGIRYSNGASNSFVYNTNLTSMSSYGMYIGGSGFVFENLLIDSAGSIGFEVLLSSNINFTNITVSNAGSIGIRQSSASNTNLTYEGVSVIDTVGNGFDYSATTSGGNNTRFINSYLANYSFGSVGHTFSVEDPVNGIVRFISAVNGSGTNLTDAIQIADNFAQVKIDENIGLNHSANITLYNTPSNGFIVDMLRNHEVCPEGICTNYTALTASTVIFNVTGFSNYSLGDGTAPAISYVAPTLSNGTIQYSDGIDVNVSSTEANNLHYVLTEFDDDLLLWMRMDDVNATGDPQDLSGKNNDGVLLNGAFINTSGRFGDGAQFDGVNDRINTSFELVFDNSDVSAFLWVRGDLTSSDLLTRCNNACSSFPNHGIIRLGVDASDSLFVSLDLDSVTGPKLTSAGWHFIGFTYNGTGDDNLTLYSGAANVGSVSSTVDSILAGPTISIGGMDGANFLNGSIDEVFIFNRTLTQTEIQALYNATTTQYYRNFTGVTSGNHTFTSHAVDQFGNLNSTDTRTIQYIPNNPPTTPQPILTSFDFTNRSNQDLRCADTVFDNDNNTMNVSVIWYNNSVQHLAVSLDNNYANNTAFETFLDAANTTKGENWTCSLQFFDGIAYSDWANSSDLFIENTLPTVTLVDPDGNLTIDRTPTFYWSGTDEDGDPLGFELNVSLVAASTCFEAERHIQDLTSEDYTLLSDLQCLYDNGDYYVWSVRANDSSGFGSWSTSFNVSIQSFINITVPNSTVFFSNLSVLQVEDTTDDDPPPFTIQNDGNVFVNINISATALWESVGHPSSYYRVKIDNFTGEEYSFNYSTSTLDWVNMPATNSSILLSLLNYSDATDIAEVDLRIQVPPNENPGIRNSTVYFIASLAE